MGKFLGAVPYLMHPFGSSTVYAHPDYKAAHMTKETFKTKVTRAGEIGHSTDSRSAVLGTDHNARTPAWSVTTSDVGYGDTLAAARLNGSHPTSPAP
jgi:hypothetical protein